MGSSAIPVDIHLKWSHIFRVSPSCGTEWGWPMSLALKVAPLAYLQMLLCVALDHLRDCCTFFCDAQAKGKLPQKGYVDNVDNGKFLDTAPTVAALASWSQSNLPQDANGNSVQKPFSSVLVLYCHFSNTKAKGNLVPGRPYPLAENVRWLEISCHRALPVNVWLKVFIVPRMLKMDSLSCTICCSPTSKQLVTPRY